MRITSFNSPIAASLFGSPNNVGKDLDGWIGDPRYWSVKNGVIQADSANLPQHSTSTLLWQGGVLTDFEFHFECKTTVVEGNGGAHASAVYRAKMYPTRNASAPDTRGYELRLCAGGHRLGGSSPGILTSRGRPGLVAFTQRIKITSDERWLDKSIAEAQLIPVSEAADLFRPDDWNHCEIVARGNHFIHKLNGKVVAELIDANEIRRTDVGSLALQFDTKNGRAFFQFRNIRLRPSIRTADSSPK